MNLVNELKAEVARLEDLLNESKRHTYIGETHSLHASNGELTIGYGDDQWLTIAVDQLFQDLPAIINLVCLEQIKQQDSTLQRIKNELKEL
jgi:hypothetical protein